MHNKPTKDDKQLQEKLNKLQGKLIHITKDQNRDIDQTTMTLSRADFHERKPTIDNYVAPFVLQLHGKGKVGTTHAQYEQIPFETYEIPLSEQHKTKIQENQISIITEDINYTIKYTE